LVPPSKLSCLSESSYGEENVDYGSEDDEDLDESKIAVTKWKFPKIEHITRSAPRLGECIELEFNEHKTTNSDYKLFELRRRRHRKKGKQETPQI
jgi:hypothetical protein